MGSNGGGRDGDKEKMDGGRERGRARGSGSTLVK